MKSIIVLKNGEEHELLKLGRFQMKSCTYLQVSDWIYIMTVNPFGSKILIWLAEKGKAFSSLFGFTWGYFQV